MTGEIYFKVVAIVNGFKAEIQVNRRRNFYVLYQCENIYQQCYEKKAIAGT
jgi:hypothetical protein